ncbi:MAG: NADH-quinone oxidoreductase subunit M [Desulfobacteraceae bacterium]|jgi:NADH-quinone oxidoreductase subunit M
MIMAWLILIPVLSGIFAWSLELRFRGSARWTALVALAVGLGFTCYLAHQPFELVPSGGPYFMNLDIPWIASAGIHFHLAMDGLSLVLVLLTHFLGIVAVLSSWTEISEKAGFFYFNLLWVLAGIIGVFLSMDLFLFYFFWEMMLIPMFFLISVYGHENRIYASVKFFLFTQISGLFMLLAILGLYFVHGKQTGQYTFNYFDLMGTPMTGTMGILFMLGFLTAFAVKLPAVPFHTWLPDAHTEAPTAGSIILAGLLLKTGAYGMIRFVIPLFPEASAAAAPAVMALSVVGIIYGALLALSQTDFKRLVAYTSVSHMGFVMLGIFAWNTLALQGAVVQMICHGLSTGALFFLAGILKDRLHTRDLGQMGGLWATAPRLAGMTLFFALASLGLPGLGNFIAEFTILMGVFQVNKIIAATASLGLVGAAVYSLWIIQAAFHGPLKVKKTFADLSFRETAALTLMLVGLVYLGLNPGPVFRMAQPSLDHLTRIVSITNPGLPNPAKPFSFNTSTPHPSENPGGTGHAIR